MQRVSTLKHQLQPSAASGVPAEGAALGTAPRVVALYTYPVKSCAGIACQRLMVHEGGFEHDREYMFVDESSSPASFVTGRQQVRGEQCVLDGFDACSALCLCVCVCVCVCVAVLKMSSGSLSRRSYLGRVEA